jgi:ankyrin repeat protein
MSSYSDIVKKNQQKVVQKNDQPKKILTDTTPPPDKLHKLLKDLYGSYYNAGMSDGKRFKVEVDYADVDYHYMYIKALYKAVCEDNLNVIKELCKYQYQGGKEFYNYYWDNDKESILMCAIEKNKLDIAEYFISKGCDLECKNKDNKTALMILLEKTISEYDYFTNTIIKLLVKAGAKYDEKYKTIIEKILNVTFTNIDISMCPDKNYKFKNTQSCLRDCIENKWYDLFKILIKRKDYDINYKYDCDVRYYDKFADPQLKVLQKTLIIMASENNDIDFVKTLIENKCDLNDITIYKYGIVTHNNKFNKYKKHNHQKIFDNYDHSNEINLNIKLIELLIKSSKNITSVDKNGENLLHHLMRLANENAFSKAASISWTNAMWEGRTDDRDQGYDYNYMKKEKLYYDAYCYYINLCIYMKNVDLYASTTSGDNCLSLCKWHPDIIELLEKKSVDYTKFKFIPANFQSISIDKLKYLLTLDISLDITKNTDTKMVFMQEWHISKLKNEKNISQIV